MKKIFRIRIQVFQFISQCFFTLIALFIDINSSNKSVAPTNFPCTMSALAWYSVYFPLSKMILSSFFEYIVATIKYDFIYLFFNQPMFFWHQWLLLFFQLLNFFILVSKGLTNCIAKNIHFKLSRYTEHQATEQI